MKDEDFNVSHSPENHDPAGFEHIIESIKILFEPRRFFLFCTSIIAFLVIMSLFSALINGPEHVNEAVRFDRTSSIIFQAFFLDKESSLPTFFNFSLLVVACSLLSFAARLAFLFRMPHRYHWLAMAIIFLFLSFDEAAQIHEKLKTPMARLFDASGIFYFAWIIPGLAFVTIFALMYLNLLRVLPSRIAWLMILGGGLYVGGAIGMEMFGGWADASGLRNTWRYVTAVTIEEGLEMLGITVFCTAMLTLFAEGSGSRDAYFKSISPTSK